MKFEASSLDRIKIVRLEQSNNLVAYQWITGHKVSQREVFIYCNVVTKMYCMQIDQNMEIQSIYSQNDQTNTNFTGLACMDGHGCLTGSIKVWNLVNLTLDYSTE